MKTIQLTKGKEALVDDVDYQLLQYLPWHAEGIKKLYACHGTFGRMHRFIMMADDDMEVDHIDGNSLNNQRNNLRLCTHKQNCQNKGKSKKGSSKYHGVYWNKVNRNWIARIKPDWKGIHIGSFKIEEDAARAYDKEAVKYFGEFANLNFKE